MFRLSTLLTSLLLASSAGAQIVGGGVGQIIGLGAGGQSSTAARVASILTGDSVLASVDLNCVTNSGFNQGFFVTPASALTVSRTTTGGVGSYIDDTNGNWKLVPDNVLRQSNKGCLVEETRTNGVRNNSMQGAVAGTPGTPPTNWGVGPGSATATIIGTGVENGIDYIDIRFFGTNVGTFAVSFEGNAQIAASNGQTWTNSVFVKLQAGSVANIAGAGVRVDEHDSGGNYLTGNNDNSLTAITGAPLGTQRHAYIYTNGNASTAFVLPSIIFFTTSGAVDITLRIGWPQMEQGAFATSPIRTTSAAVTRSADVVTLTSVPTFAAPISLFAQGFSERNAPDPSNNHIIWSWYASVSGEGNNSAQLGLHGGGSQATGFARAGGVVFDVLSGGSWTDLARHKLAAAFATGSQAAAFDSAAPGTGTAAGTMVSLDTVVVGLDATAGNENWNGYIERVAAWVGYRISNAGLQTLTTLP